MCLIVCGQYQFKTAEETSDLDATIFFGGTDLYSDHWVTSCILVLAGLPGTIFRLALQNQLW